MEINLELRTEVLRYSLHLEEGINNLLLLNLGIFDVGRTTRLFGNRAGISYKQKIDLLFDIEVLTKEENSEMELLSVFRNKLLHDIYFDSMLSVINNLDGSIRSKFKLYFDAEQRMENETDCRAALSKLFLKNIRTISLKNKHLREINEQKNDLFLDDQKRCFHHIDVFYDLINEVSLNVEEANLENPEVQKLAEKILITLEKSKEKFSYTEGKVFSAEVFASIFGIRKMGETQSREINLSYDEYYKARSKSQNNDNS